MSSVVIIYVPRIALYNSCRSNALVPLLLFVFVDPGIESTDYTCCHEDNGKHRCYSEWLPEVCNEWYFVRCLQNTSELKAITEEVVWTHIYHTKIRFG